MQPYLIVSKIGISIALDIRVGQQRPSEGKEAAVFVAKKSGGGSTFVSIPINLVLLLAIIQRFLLKHITNGTRCPVLHWPGR